MIENYSRLCTLINQQDCLSGLLQYLRRCGEE